MLIISWNWMWGIFGFVMSQNINSPILIPMTESFRFYVHKPLLLLLSTGPPFCLHILHCHSKRLSQNWADFRNLKSEYLPNYWSDLSEINCNGFSFKSPLIWYTSFNQRHRAIFGCCIATFSQFSQNNTDII